MIRVTNCIKQKEYIIYKLYILDIIDIMSFSNRDVFMEPRTVQYGSHMVTTNVHKTHKSKYISLDTKYRDDFSYSHVVNYNITLPEKVSDVKTMKIHSVELPGSLLNVSSDLGNNTFKMVSNSNIAIIVVPDGKYTETTLQDAIQTKINGSGSNTSDMIIDISNQGMGYVTKLKSSNSDIAIDFSVRNGCQDQLDSQNFTTSLGWMLGFRKPTLDITTSDTISTSLLNLNVPSYLYLAIDEYQPGNQNNFLTPLSNSLINKNIIARISIDNKTYGLGNVMIANEGNGLLVSSLREYSSMIDLQKLNVKLIYDNGKITNLQGLDFSLVLEIVHE